MLGWDHEAASPLSDDLVCKERRNALDQGIPTRVAEANQQQSPVCSGRVNPHVRKIEVLGDQKTVPGLSGLPDLLVGLSGKVLGSRRVYVMPQLS